MAGKNLRRGPNGVVSRLDLKRPHLLHEGMELIDTHCHLAKAHEGGQLAEVLQRAEAAGVRSMIAVGTSLKDWELYRSMAERHAGTIYWTVGIHPCSVDEGWNDELNAISTFFATSPAPVALGEIGLDHFHLPKYPDEIAEVKALQASAFRSQLQLAYQLECPVVIHSRNAFMDCVRMIDESGVDWTKVVFHCFTEGPEAMKVLLDRGGRGSFTGIVTYKNAESIRAAAALQGLERLMIETDAPYLTPEPNRGKPNEPAFLRDTASCLAGLMGIDPTELARRTTSNARSFFGIPN